MHESKDDLDQLRGLLDQSYAGAGEHLRSIFDGPARLSAEELAAGLDGIFEMHLATLAGDGAPLVAPIDGIFFRGEVFFGLPAESVRIRLVRRDPRVSASYTRESFAFIVHGRAREVDEASPLAKEL